MNGEVIEQLIYADEEDTKKAIQSASIALIDYAKTTITERAEYLKRIHEQITKRIDDLIEVTILEYGATKERTRWSNLISATTFLNHIKVMEKYDFKKRQMNQL